MTGKLDTNQHPGSVLQLVSRQAIRNGGKSPHRTSQCDRVGPVLRDYGNADAQEFDVQSNATRIAAALKSI